MTRGPRAIAGLLALLGVACDGGAQTPVPDRPDAAAGLRSTVILEPSKLEVGETAVVEVAIVTPPGWSVPPVPPPGVIEGIWLIDAERPTVVEEPSRWVHRNRFRIRARTPGPFEWPAATVDAEGPDGSRERLTAGPRGFEVVAVSREFPDQRTFLSYLRPPEPSSDANPWLAGALGAALAFASVGLVSLVRRVRANAGSSGEAGAVEAAPWRATQASLETAAAIAGDDPVRAADQASGAVRLYVARRFDARDVLAASTPELAAREAPFLLTTRWEALVQVLASLDGVRFLPVEDEASTGRAAAAAIAQAQDLIIDMSPRGNTR